MDVAIPHGGLRTSCPQTRSCPSTTVAIPHGGLGTNVRSVLNLAVKMSPSHTVGLELKYLVVLGLSHLVVAIPHGGLRTITVNTQNGYLMRSRHPTRWA